MRLLYISEAWYAREKRAKRGIYHKKCRIFTINLWCFFGVFYGDRENRENRGRIMSDKSAIKTSKINDAPNLTHNI